MAVAVDPSPRTAPSSGPAPTAREHERRFCFALFADNEARRPRRQEATWDALVRLLTVHRERPAKDGPAFSPVAYRAGATRGNAGVAHVDLLVLDYDHADIDRGRLRGLTWLAYTTYRHAPDAPRHRVVIPFSRRVLPAEWPSVWARAIRALAPEADPACKEPARLFYLPTCAPGAPRHAEVHEGAYLDPDTLPALPIDEPPPRPERAATQHHPTGGRPGDEWTAVTPWEDVLHPHGWRDVAQRGDTTYWLRPENGVPHSAKWSASVGGGNHDVFYCFSSNAPPFEPQTSYTKFAVYALLEHGGDFAAATRALADEGYGTPAPASTTVDSAPPPDEPPEWATDDAGPTPESTSAPAGAADEAQTASRFQLLTFSELAHLPRPEPLVQNALFRDTLAAIVGPQGSFKSFVALDLCLCVATGTRWQGRYVQQGPAVYVSAEGSRGLTQRAEAWSIARGVPIPPTARFITEPPQLLDPKDVDQLLIRLEGLYPKPLLVVFDTVARCMVGGDENSARDMGQFVAAADRIRRATGATVLLIHHVSRAGNTRGSTAFPAALDTEIMVERKHDVVVLTCTKQKDAADFLPITFVSQIVTLPEGGSSVVLNPSAAVEDERLGPNERRVAEILDDVFGTTGATNGQWEQACAEATPTIPHMTYYRAKTRLLEAGEVVTTDDCEPGKRGAHFILASRRYHGTKSVPNGTVVPNPTGDGEGTTLPHSFRSGSVVPTARAGAGGAVAAESCVECGGELERFAPDGTPYCARHLPGRAA